MAWILGSVVFAGIGINSPGGPSARSSQPSRALDALIIGGIYTAGAIALGWFFGLHWGLPLAPLAGWNLFKAGYLIQYFRSKGIRGPPLLTTAIARVISGKIEYFDEGVVKSLRWYNPTFHEQTHQFLNKF